MTFNDLFYFVRQKILLTPEIGISIDALHGKVRENPRRWTWCLRVGKLCKCDIAKSILPCLHTLIIDTNDRLNSFFLNLVCFFFFFRIVSSLNIMKTLTFLCMLGYFGVAIIHRTLT